MKNGLKKTIRFYPVLLGAAAGFLYYSFIGCVTGSCAVTSNPWSSTIIGAVFGAAFIKKKINRKADNQNLQELK